MHSQDLTEHVYLVEIGNKIALDLLEKSEVTKRVTQMLGESFQVSVNFLPGVN